MNFDWAELAYEDGPHAARRRGHVGMDQHTDVGTSGRVNVAAILFDSRGKVERVRIRVLHVEARVGPEPFVDQEAEPLQAAVAAVLRTIASDYAVPANVESVSDDALRQTNADAVAAAEFKAERLAASEDNPMYAVTAAGLARPASLFLPE